MRESCKTSGASKARGSDAGGVAARGKFRPGSPGAGETMKLTSGARVAVTEGGGGRLEMV
jgi:hypothetical protein